MKTSSIARPCLVLLTTLAALPTPAAEAPAADTLEEVVVFARGEKLIGIAAAASEGAVGGADLSVRPLLRVAELLEAVPGLIAAQHSGSGKANQYFLRGFNLDHGTDFTTYLDGVPLNLRSHGHGQGYLDVNGLIPEIVERIDYRKGPYRADLGDFALAGAALMTTIDRVDRPFVAIESGQYGWKRVAGGTNIDVGPGELMLVGQWKGYDGPWQLPEDLKHFSGYGKYSQTTGLGELQVSLSAYNATWRPTEQIPERAIGTPICANEYCALDTTATGETTRYIATARLVGEGWQATVYSQFYDWNMYSDSTYDFQIRQWDRRFTHGGRFEKQVELAEKLHLNFGGEGRYDDAGKVEVDHTEARNFIEPIAAHKIVEGSLAGFAEATYSPIEDLRLTAGLRADWYSFKATALDPQFLSGSKDDSLVSPKLGLAYKLNPAIEFYANWGRGFHSNDARGVTASDPPVPGLIVGIGKEAGARFQSGNFNVTATYWWLDVDSELKFVGDSNSVEPGPASRRRGYELVGFWRPMPWLAIDAVWTVSHARYENSPGQEHIAGAVENAGELGVSAVQGPWEASVRLRHLGPYPLIEDNSFRSDAEDVVNLRAAWKNSHFMLYGELLNVFGSHGKDVVYYYETYLPAIDPAPTEGRVSRAEEPRTVRVGLKYSF
ncbi:MAG TPA: TonB-dependent receptor [Steroidobacteraceae bacterium]|nr:TonB-dependent receptor [Steroidobacteraceae bacterium]